MGSAEASDDNSGRLFSSFGLLPKVIARTRSTFAPLDQKAPLLSPGLQAIGLCLTLGLGLFVFSDTLRTLSEAEARLSLLADFAVSGAADAGSDGMSDLFASLAPMRGEAQLHALDRTGKVVATTDPELAVGASIGLGALEAENVVVIRPLPQGRGMIAVTQDRPSVLGAVWQRAGTALGLCALIGLLSVWRTPSVARRHSRDTLGRFIDDLPFGLAFWSDDAQLVLQNGVCRKLMERAGCSHTERSYSGFRKALADTGRLEILSDDENGRLSVFRQDGAVQLFIEERPLAEGGFMTLVGDLREGPASQYRATTPADQAALTQQLQVEIDRAMAASRTKTAFLAHLSHEIRTPLNHIIGFADLICHQSFGPVGDQRYSDYVRYIRQSGEKLLASFAEILELAELEGGKRQMSSEPVAVMDLLRQTKRRFAPQAERSNITLAVADAADVDLHGDRHYLLRMLSNIVENALRYTPAGGVVILKAWPAEDGVVLEITDSGIGMSAARLETLGADFVLGAGAFKREQGGAGLGVAIARSIAELSGGSLAVDSTPDLGTTVAIALPLKAARPAARQAAA